MRHLKAGRRLGVTTSHRRAMMRNLVTSLLEHEEMRTTLARAKEVRKPLDRMITLGKQGDLSGRRQALAFVKSKAAMAALFGELAERYKDRNGGYSRILRLGPRRGDGAEMVLIMLVGSPNDPFADEKKPRRKGAGKKKDKAVLEDVAAEVVPTEPMAEPSEDAAGESPAETVAEAGGDAQDSQPEGEAEKQEG